MSTGIVLTGKRGDGKTLSAVGKIQEYLLAGRIVATNLNLFVEHLLPLDNQTAKIYRIPDHPKIEDFEALPRGNLTMNEEMNGLLVLDEAATWLNARSWNENPIQRQAIISWFLHSRKHGWDLIIITQHQNLLDKQLRDSLFEFHALSKRLDKVAIPFLSAFFKIFDVKLRPPKIHLVVVRYGLAGDSPVADRWLFRGTALYSAYDTNQLISPLYSPGLHSMLTPWHLSGRYLTRFQMYKKVMIAGMAMGLLIGSFLTMIYSKYSIEKKINSAFLVNQVDKDIKLVGYSTDGATINGILSDGRSVSSTEYQTTENGMSIKVGQKWFGK
jgi:hypothetical protein